MSILFVGPCQLADRAVVQDQKKKKLHSAMQVSELQKLAMPSHAPFPVNAVVSLLTTQADTLCITQLS